MEDNEIYNRLEQVDWATMHVSLLRFARKHVRDDRNGRTPEDLVQSAIEKTYRGALSRQRRWGARIWDGEVNLYTFLCGVIKSQGSNLLRSQEHQSVVYLKQPELEEQKSSGRYDPADSYDIQELQAALLAAIKGRKHLERVWEMLLRGYSEPAEIAHELDVPIEMAYRWKRQLKMLVHKVQNKLQQMPSRPSLPEKKPMRRLWKTSPSQSETPLHPPRTQPNS